LIIKLFDCQGRQIHNLSFKFVLIRNYKLRKNNSSFYHYEDFTIILMSHKKAVTIHF